MSGETDHFASSPEVPPRDALPAPVPSDLPPAIPVSDALRVQCIDRLDRFPRRTVGLDERRRAAVAITVMPTPDDKRVTIAAEAAQPASESAVAHPALSASFLLTLRAPRLSSHAGQYALPGGRVDEGEDAATAARRELAEEVGLATGPDSILGLLDDYETRSGYVVTPVVIWIDGHRRLVPEPGEVADVFHIGLHELLREDSPILVPIPESDRPVVQLPTHVTRLHAPTAAMVFQFAEVCLRGRWTRVDHLEEPVWAWR